jgi:hypothetical protein
MTAECSASRGSDDHAVEGRSTAGAALAVGLLRRSTSHSRRERSCADDWRPAYDPGSTDCPKALEALQLGFVPGPQLDVRGTATPFVVRRQSLHWDLIPPGREGQDAPIYIPRFHAAAAPIQFLSIATHEALPAVAVNGSTAMFVVVPHPAR